MRRTRRPKTPARECRHWAWGIRSGAGRRRGPQGCRGDDVGLRWGYGGIRAALPHAASESARMCHAHLPVWAWLVTYAGITTWHMHARELRACTGQRRSCPEGVNTRCAHMLTCAHGT